MNTKHLLAAILITTLPSASLGATLEERVEALERRDTQLYQTLEERTEAGLKTFISERISLAGLLEVEGYFENLSLEGDLDDENTSDLVLATVQLAFEAEIQEHLGATIIFLYEEEEDAVIEVDEATLDYSRDFWSARLGRQYLPFGLFPSHMISDPITLNLGETKETAVLVGYGQDRFQISVWAANGDAEHHDAAGHVNDWGAGITLNPADSFELGAGFLSDLADTDAELVSNYQDRVAGWSAYAVVGVNRMVCSGEILAAASTFHKNDLDEDGDGSGDRPLAWNVEVSAEIWPSVELAARLEGSDEFAEEPELQYGVALSWSPWENVLTAVEYLRGEFDEDFGAGVDSRNLVTAQLAAEF